MAWRSSGTTNDEMVDKMKRFGVISTPAIEAAFRQVDRAFFVPAVHKSVAHKDQPLREGNLHISAPHIYGTALEALELRPNSSLSFLNLGSGTGYLSCIVASVLGCHSNNYGVDIHADVVEHARASTELWKNSHDKSFPHIEWVHGNALDIDPEKGEALVGFDRIYVGASVDKEDIPKLAFLLRPGGILVGPVEEELVKIVKIGCSSGNLKLSSSSMMETDDPNPLPPTEFTHQVLSAVRFAALLARPNINTVLSSTVWNPSIHYQYPDSFRNSCREILLCSNAPRRQAPPQKPKETGNAACLLPRVLWMEILSYTHRDWFEVPESETDFLRRRVLEEQESAARAHQARMEAETRWQLAEEERDVYKILARRYQLRLAAARHRTGRNEVAGDSDLDSDEEEEQEEELREAIVPVNGRALSGREQAVIFGLGAMLRGIQYESEGDDDDDDIDEEDGDEEGDEESDADHNVHLDADRSGDDGGMEEDTSLHEADESNAEMADQDGEDDHSDVEDPSSFIPLGAEDMAISHSSPALVVRQPRTISITSEAL